MTCGDRGSGSIQTKMSLRPRLVQDDAVVCGGGELGEIAGQSTELKHYIVIHFEILLIEKPA